MRPSATAILVLIGATSGGVAWAELPPGHPSAAPPASSAPTLAPPPSSALPPGHPNVATGPQEDDDSEDSDPESSAMPAGHPGMDGSEGLKDTVVAAPNLAPGTIEVHVADGTGRPLANTPVRLGLMRQDVATGNSNEERTLNTDATGTVTFQRMPIGTEYSYRATVRQGAGSYASDPFRLDERTGQRVLVHVYPVTSDIRQAMVGMRAVVFVQPREDIFQIETTIQVLNIGQIAWVPDNVRIPLAEGAKAFRASESMHDTAVERSKDGEVTLHGTFSPGQHEVTFQYQIDSRHEPAQRFRMGLPPHVAEMRVYSEGPREMRLVVQGYPPAEKATSQTGGHLLVTGRRATRGDAPLDAIDVTLENLPVPAQGRWYAAFLALGLAAFGVWSGFLRKSAKPASRGNTAEIKEAEELVYRELVVLERLEREGQIGPKAYAEARTELLDVLSRLAARGAGATAS